MRRAKGLQRLLPSILTAGVILLKASASVEDGLGTNHVGVLRADAIQIATETWTNFPPRAQTAGGGPINFRNSSNVVFWTSALLASGTLQQALVQTDEGSADINIVRAKWNDAWGSYTVVGSFQAGSGGTAFSGWTSSWVSNDYRIGVVVTNFTTGTNLWWSIEYTR